MQLTAVEFARLLKEFKCDAKPGDRRTNPRAPTHVRAHVVPVPRSGPLGAGVQVWVRDVSRGGFGLTAQSSFGMGDHLIVLLPMTGTDVYALLCQIVRVQRMAGGETFMMGAQMVRRITPEEYAAAAAGDAATLALLSRPATPATPAAA